MATATVRNGQTLLDVAVQHLGSADGVADLAFLNGLDVTADVSVGLVLQLPTVSNKRVVKVLKDGGHVPATNLDGDGEGVEFWAIEQDFIIS